MNHKGLTDGQWDRIKDLVEGLPGEHLLAGKAGMEAAIPPNRSRSQLIPHDKEVYRERHLVERFINKTKRFRCIATCYEKTDTAYMAMLFLAGAV